MWANLKRGIKQSIASKGRQTPVADTFWLVLRPLSGGGSKLFVKLTMLRRVGMGPGQAFKIRMRLSFAATLTPKSSKFLEKSVG